MKRTVVTLLCALLLVLCLAAPVSAFAIDSPYGVVVNAADGSVLYEKNADVPRPVGSVTKLMPLLLIFEEIDSGRMSLDTKITITAGMQAAALNPYWSNIPLYKGQVYTARQLLSMICVESACGAVVVFAEYISGSTGKFVARMNAKAKELGLNAHFYDVTGVSPNGKITARSLGKLATHLVNEHPGVLKFTSLTSTTINGQKYYATNRLLPGKDYAYAGADGLKTGTTTPAGACLVATAKRGGTRIISVVLASSSYTERYRDATAMLNYGFSAAKLYPLAFKDVSVNAWYFKAVKEANELGLVQGVSKSSFAPGGEVTRAMFVTVLGRLWEQTQGALAPATATRFSDVDLDAYYGKYVAWAESNGIVNGFEDNSFRPHEPISREQIMTIFYQFDRYANTPPPDPEATPPAPEDDPEVTGSGSAVQGNSDLPVADGVIPAADAALSEQEPQPEAEPQPETDPLPEAPQPSPSALDKYSDGGTVSTWARDGVIWCLDNGVVTGTGDGRIAPLAHAIRAELAQILIRYYHLI